MGLSLSFLNIMLGLKRAGTIERLTQVIEIGAQQLSNEFLHASSKLDELYHLYGRPRIQLGDGDYQGMRGSIEHQPADAPASRLFWESLGFTYAAADFGGHRASIAIDLNRDRVTDDLRGRFQLVVNAGTTEHVANQDNAFRIIHDLVCIGGIMIHFVPAQGMMMHGLFNYNPKFFWHLCRENGYEVLELTAGSDGLAMPVPNEVIDSNTHYANVISEQPLKAGQLVSDFSIVAVLRKLNDEGFVTPMDL